MEEWPGRISYITSLTLPPLENLALFALSSDLVWMQPFSTAGTVRVPRTTEGTTDFLSCINCVVHSIPRPVCHWRKVKGVDKRGELKESPVRGLVWCFSNLEFWSCDDSLLTSIDNSINNLQPNMVRTNSSTLLAQLEPCAILCVYVEWACWSWKKNSCRALLLSALLFLTLS